MIKMYKTVIDIDHAHQLLMPIILKKLTKFFLPNTDLYPKVILDPN